MKSFLQLCLIGTFVWVVSGCAENQTRVGEGAGIGGVLGAAAGGIIGHQSDDGIEGALIGGAIGAASGAVIGAQMPKEPTTRSYVSPSGTINHVTTQQIVDWTRQGLSSDDIIVRIRNTNSTYALTADDIGYLRKQGVSQRVIEAMQATR